MTNEELNGQFEAFMNGDTDAFLLIYEKLKIPIFTIIYRILYDHMMAEDVMQEIFLRLYKSPPPFHVKKPRAWIFQMARNLAIDYRRKTKVSETLSQQTEASYSPLELSVGTRIDVERAMRCLPTEEREIVTLYLQGDLKFREIANLMNKPLGTILWKYRKSINKLREILSGGA